MQLYHANSLTLKDAALYYASTGLPVFPLQPGTKDPIPGLPWKRGATTNANVIENWWTLYPDANIGMPLGSHVGFNALDIDRKNDGDGYQSLASIPSAHYRGPVQFTPNSGEHRLYRYDSGFTNFTRRGSHGGLDMRTDGGYIVVAPSVRPEGRYQWQADQDLPPMDGVLRDTCYGWSQAKDAIAETTPMVPDNVVDYRSLGLKDKYVGYLETGDHSPWNSERGPDESAAIYAVAGAVMRVVQDEVAAFGVMASNPYAYACAERHRKFGNPTDWLWEFGVGPMIKAAKRLSVSEAFRPLAAANDNDSYELIPNPDKPWQNMAPPGKPPAIQNPDKPWEMMPAPNGPPPPIPEGQFFIGAKQGFAHFLRPERWIIRGLMEYGQVCSIYGPSGTYKSFLALDMCLRISLGLDWHRRKIYDHRYCMYITSEGQEGIWKRVEAWRQTYNHANSADITWDDIENSGFAMSLGGVNLMDPETLKPINDLVHSRNQAPAMIVVDTLASNNYGNENAVEDISKIVNTLKGAAKAYDAAVMVVHHTGNVDNGRMRGSSALYAGLDCVLQVTAKSGDGRVVTLHSTKAKDSEMLSEVYFELDRVNVLGLIDREGQMASSLVPRLVERQHENVSMASQLKLKTKTADVLNVVLETITVKGQLGEEGSIPAATYDEIWEAHQVAYLEKHDRHTRQATFRKTMDLLVGMGLVGLRNFDNFAWYTKPAYSDTDDAGPE